MSRYYNFLVTGGLGFIGSHLVEHLLDMADGKQVHDIDSGRNYHEPPESRLKKGSNSYHLYKEDLCSSRIRSIIKNKAPDCIIHVAAESHVDRAIKDPQGFAHSNITATVNLMEGIRQAKAEKIINPGFRFVYVSTDEVYGPQSDPVTEDQLIAPTNPYSASKAAAENIVMGYGSQYNIDYVITRGCNTFGPGQLPEKMIPKSIYSLFNGCPADVYYPGDQQREWMHVSDHVSGILWALQYGDSGKTYNLGSGSSIQNLELIKLLYHLMLKHTRPDQLIEYKHCIRIASHRPNHDHAYSLDSSAALKGGWKRRNKSFIDNLDATIEWYVSNYEWLRKAYLSCFPS